LCKIISFIHSRLNIVLNIKVFFFLPHSTHVKTRSAFHLYGNVMGTMTVGTTQMRPRTARTGSVRQITSSMYYEKVVN
jgi:hypothetical protein